MTSPDAQARLKACPWCAEMPNTDDGRDTDYGPRVWCANFPHCPVEPVAEGGTMADAIENWNTRTPDAQPSSTEGEVERLREALTEALAAIDEMGPRLGWNGGQDTAFIKRIGEVKDRARAAIAAQVTKP